MKFKATEPKLNFENAKQSNPFFQLSLSEHNRATPACVIKQKQDKTIQHTFIPQTTVFDNHIITL